MVGITTLFLDWFLSGTLGSKIVSPILNLKELRKLSKGIPFPSILKTKSASPDIEPPTQNELYGKNLQLKAANHRFEEPSFTDQLASLFNRHRLRPELEKEPEWTKHYNNTFRSSYLTWTTLKT